MEGLLIDSTKDCFPLATKYKFQFVSQVLAGSRFCVVADQYSDLDHSILIRQSLQLYISKSVSEVKNLDCPINN